MIDRSAIACHHPAVFRSPSIATIQLQQEILIELPGKMGIEESQIIKAAEGLLKDCKSEGVFDRRWNAAFGARPHVCCILWDMLEPERTMPPGAQLKHLLWGLLFMTTYDIEETLAHRAKVDEKTFRKWSQLFVVAISYLECDVVSSASLSSSSITG